MEVVDAPQVERLHGQLAALDGVATRVKEMEEQLGHLVCPWPGGEFYCNQETLVGGLEQFLFFHVLGISSSQLTFIFVQGVQTTNQNTMGWTSSAYPQVFGTYLETKDFNHKSWVVAFVAV